LIDSYGSSAILKHWVSRQSTLQVTVTNLTVGCHCFWFRQY